MKKLKQALIAAVVLIILTGIVTLLISPSVLAQVGDKVKTAVLVVNTPAEPVPVAGTVNVGNTPSVNVNNPVDLVGQDTALAFQALDVSFSALEGMGDIAVDPYDKIRVVVLNRSFSVSLVVNVVESGQVVGTLDVIDVPGCDGGGSCVGTRSISRVYDVPGRAIRFSTNADPRADGDVHVFGR